MTTHLDTAVCAGTGRVVGDTTAGGTGRYPL